MALRDKAFWETHYELELKNYEEDGDEGDVWFGKALSRRIASWILNDLQSRPTLPEKTKILDVGCGNAFFLLTFIKKHSSQIEAKPIELVGIDYSTSSIELSKKIVAAHGYDGDIKLKQCDFLNSEQVSSALNSTRYNFVVDIGTLDAICLLASETEGGIQLAIEKYMKSLGLVLNNTSIFVLASCNHTELELITILKSHCSPDHNFELIDKIDTPKLQFGGKVGSQVTCLLFQFSNQ